MSVRSQGFLRSAGRIARSPQLFPGPGQPSRKQRPDSSYCFQCYIPITGWRASPAFKCNAGCLGLTIRLFILRYKSLFLQNRNQTTCLGGQLPFITNNKNCTIYGPLKNPINPDGEKRYDSVSVIVIHQVTLSEKNKNEPSHCRVTQMFLGSNGLKYIG